MSALARELEEARKRAGDASEEAARLRCTLTATEADASYWRAECRAAEVTLDSARVAIDRERAAHLAAMADRDGVLEAVELALGTACTGDLARDVAGLVATLREALARAREDGINALQRKAHLLIVDAWDTCRDHGQPFELRHAVPALDLAARECRAAQPAPQPETCQLPETPATAAPTLTSEQVRALLVEGDAVAADLKRRMRGKGATASAVAPAVGDPVRVRLDGRAVEGTVTRAPSEGTREGYRVETVDGREAYGRAADLELLAGEK